jgi:uncharacterized damage-inducible protein DinB
MRSGPPSASKTLVVCMAPRTPRRAGRRRDDEDLEPVRPLENMEALTMDEKTLVLAFWEKEAPSTRKVLSRIPEGSSYRPDPKSRTAREIAWLIVREEIILAEGLQRGRLEWTEVPPPDTMREVLEAYDRHHTTFLDRLRAVDAAHWERHVPFFYEGQEVMNETGSANAWGFLFDIIHHRGQLSTYLRPMGSTVPQIYGPSADEPM